MSWLREHIFVRDSVFWRIAKLLIGLQAGAGLLAVGLALYFAVSQSFNLMEKSLTRRVENLADEIERRALFPTDSTFILPNVLHLDLHTRFDDPIYFVDVNGYSIKNILEPNANKIEGIDTDVHAQPPRLQIPKHALKQAKAGNVFLEVSSATFGNGETFAIAPIYSPSSNQLLGAIWIAPLRQSISNELLDVRSAFLKALLWVLLIGGISSVLIGSLLTWRLVHPLRQMTSQVEAIGAGNYAERVEYADADELGRLAEAINQMAHDVEQSVIQLKATDQMRRELIANVGHDLRTPVAAVMGYLEEAERHTLSGKRDAATDCLQNAQNQAEYLKRLINDLFELSLWDSGKQPIRLEPIPIAELLHEAIRVQKKAFEQAKTHLKADFQSGLPILEADGLRLLRVLDNLLSNALHYTPEGSTVTLRAETMGKTLRISVQDNGEGMTEEEVARIFERYYRGNDARTRSKKGTGLGLAICKAIIEAHHGKIEVQSQKGQGSTFVIELPV